MNCPFCGTTNPDNGAFCVHCGKNLQAENRPSVTPSIVPEPASTEETLADREDKTLTNSSDHIDAEDTQTAIEAQKSDNLENDPASIPETAQSEEAATVEEMPTQITSNPGIESEPTSVGSPNPPEAAPQQEQADAEPQRDVASEKTIAAATASNDIAPPDDPTISSVDQPPTPQQEPPVYPVYTEYATNPGYPAPGGTPGNPNYPGYPAPGGTPSNPNYPGYPAPGGTPSNPNYPGYPAPGGTPSNPNYPGYPPPAGTPSNPNYPGYPPPAGMYQSAPGYPGYPQGQPGVSGTQYPPVNGYPPLPGSYNDQTSGQPTAGYPYPPTMVQQPVKRARDARIAHPLPRWILILCIIAVLAILVALQLTGSDWADGALHAAIGAIVIAVLLLVFAGIRTFLGMANPTNTKRRMQYITSALAIMLLFVYSGLDLIGQTPLHTLQAQYVEGQQHWQQAINEYELGGETAPTSVNLARTYDEWGDALNQSGHYSDALSKYNTTLNNYTTPNEITRAQKGEINSYLQMGKQATQNNNTALAIKNFDTALGLSFCHTDCQNQINPLDSTAYYNLAQSQLNTQQWDDAINNFKTVQSRFANYPEAKKVHSYLATALMGKGKQDRSNVCSSAVPTYQDLAQNYADTPEGKDATSELSQPQPVTGHFTSPLPTDAIPMAVLTTTPLNGNMTNDQFGPIIENSSITALVKSDGTFQFSPQKQGTYDLAWVNILNDGSGIYEMFYYKVNDPGKAASYVADVGPLCPFDFGDIAQPIAHQ